MLHSNLGSSQSIAIIDVSKKKKKKERKEYKEYKSTTGSISKRTESRVLKRYLHTHVHSSAVHNSEEVETTETSMDGRVDEVWCMHTLEYRSALKRKEILSMLQHG